MISSAPETELVDSAKDAVAICRRADQLMTSGGYEEAIALYRQALRVRPDHAIAANNMGNAYQKMGRFNEAIECYRQARDIRPDNAEIRTNLGRALDAAGNARPALEELNSALKLAPDSAEIHFHIATLLEHQLFLQEARSYYEAALRLKPNYPAAQIGLGDVLADLGFEDAAWEQRRLGYADRVLSTTPSLRNDRPVRILKLMSAAGGNVPLDTVLTPFRFEVSGLIVEFAERLPPLDGFHAVINAIGDADRCRRGLDAATALLRGTSVRLFNAPEQVLVTGRETLSVRLRGLEGVRTARVRTLPRELFCAGRAAAMLAAEGWHCPLLLRAVGFHSGHHFPKVETFAQLDAAGAALPGDEVLAIEWLDSRAADGLFRKYRAMLIGGAIYPLHLAVARQWKVHYFSSEMAKSSDYRAEELRYLADPEAVIGSGAMAALHRIREALGLDYAGVDFALGADGEVLVFEANATMRIVPPPSGPLGDDRRPFIERAMEAARALFSR
jgi:thioredoxin-like negative regulator of GroEL